MAGFLVNLPPSTITQARFQWLHSRAPACQSHVKQSADLLSIALTSICETASGW